jgi:NADH:ubiquinone oxidoreductase subunit 6 (subunit J)
MMASILHLVLLGLMVVFFILAIALRDLLKSAIALAFGSAVLAIILYQLKAPYAGVFELSIGAGLIMVLFISAISLTRREKPENEEKKKSPLLIIPLLLLIGIALSSILVALFVFRKGIVPALGENGFSQTLWQVRWLDIVGQLGIILAGVLAVSALFRMRGKK